MKSRVSNRKKVHMRIRKNMRGTAAKPRLTVFKSNKKVYCQLIDDINGITIASANSSGLTGTKSEQANAVGKKIAEAAKAANIDEAVFDRSGYIFHGRVKSIADGAREAGLKI